MNKKTSFLRGERGKLICVWSPVLHGEGCSTLACSIGFSIQQMTGRKVLIVNKSNSTSNMEKYLEKDIEIKYSMDNLKIFNMGIRTEHILTYATQVNTDLYMIAGSRFNRDITKENYEFDRIFMDKCLEGFDIVIADIDTGVRSENSFFLDSADCILAVLTPNEITIQELFNNPALKSALKYFTDERTVNVINKLHGDWNSSRVIDRYNSSYSLTKTFGLNYDGDVLNACCSNRNYYSFVIKEMKCRRNLYVSQLIGVCEFLLKEISMEADEPDRAGYGRVFKKLIRSALY